MDFRSPDEILSEIDSVLDEMIEFSQKKLQTLVSGDAQGLSEIVLCEIKLLERLSLMEEKCRGTSPGVLQSPPGAETISTHPLVEGVRNKAAILKEANELNQALIVQGMKIVEHEMRFLTGQEPGYEIALSRPLVFDKRA